MDILFTLMYEIQAKFEKKKKSLHPNNILQYLQIAVWLKNLFKELYRDWIFQERILKKAKQEVMKIYLDEESLKFAWGLMGCPNPYKLQQVGSAFLESLCL